jgi:MFS superfamily sulfate permease-like transporter
MADPHPATPDAAPFRPGLGPNLKFDVLSGFLVFLIALPLCLAIANGYRFPPIAGVWTAVLGGILTTFISNSQMTIKGPAAGMLVIVVGAVNGFEADIVRDRLGNHEATSAQVKDYLDAAPQQERDDILRAAYTNTLGVAVVAGIIQILFGLFRAGALAELCPMTPIHALLASIGIIIVFKMVYQLTGTKAPPGDEAIHAVLGVPAALPNAVRDVTVVGLAGLAIMIGWSFVTNKKVKKVPAQLVVLLVCVPLALGLGLQDVLNENGKPKFLVPMPNVLADPASAFAFPVFDRVTTWTGIQSIILFALIGSLESILSAKAVDLIDPYRRKTDLNRDILAVGVANTACAFIGAPPMISEIVRSKANIDNGARTKYADLFHGLFLLLAAVFLSSLLAYIPLAALAAMLVYTGYRLAHPREFVNTYKIGPEQLVVFLITIVTILATDLLIGFLAGVGAKFLFHLLRGVGPGKLFRSDVEIIDQDEKEVELRVRGAAVFSNWLGLKKKILAVADGKAVIIDLSRTKFVDHSTMEKLHELEMEYRAKGRVFEVRGLDKHVPVSNHPLAARKLGDEKVPVG